MSSDDEGLNQPAAEVAEELDSIGRTLSLLASQQPLLSEAYRAQIQDVLESIAAHTVAKNVPVPDFSAMQHAIARSVNFDTSRLFESIRRATGMPGLQVAFRDALTPSFTEFASLTNRATYAHPDPPKAAYSTAMTSPGAYFASDEILVSSFQELSNAIAKLIAKVPDLQLVWRGHRDADWGIHSALFRRLMAVNGVRGPEDRPLGAQPFPHEDQMVAAEREILREARSEWRFDGLGALETFARVQHAGGPTRLLDVTKNPFIGAWFAVESDQQHDGRDGRLIAFATSPVLNGTSVSLLPSQISLDSEWGAREPAWHGLTNAVARQSVDWGTGARRRLWVPPAYDPRISAQNAAFIIDGVPITTPRTQLYFKSQANPATYWTRADLLAASSIFAKTFKPTRKPRANRWNLAPTFTFRIASEAKEEVRSVLTDFFGYTRSYIYPDVPALAEHIRKMDLPALGD